MSGVSKASQEASVILAQTAPSLVEFSAADLRAAIAAGLSAIEWHDRGRPMVASASKPKRSRAKGAYRSSLEAAYAERLEMLRLLGRIVTWSYEARTFTVGIKSRYTPDFRVVVRIGLTRFVEIQYHECKGRVNGKIWRADGSLAKLRAAALLYPRYTFVLVVRDRGEWITQSVGAT